MDSSFFSEVRDVKIEVRGAERASFKCGSNAFQSSGQ